jgi:FkbM family methyltransferase
VETITLGDGTNLKVAAPYKWPEYWSLVQNETWERYTVATIRSLTPGSVMLEIGGWIGSTALIAAAVGAEVHSFEPDPKALVAFRQHLEWNPELAQRITLHAAAVSTETGRAILANDSLGDSTSSLVKRKGETVEVDTVDVRDLLPEPWIDRVALVKLDIEGGEYQLAAALADVLKRIGTPRFLLSTHVDYLQDLVPINNDVVRKAVIRVYLLRHPLVVWKFRCYTHWHIPAGAGWRPVNRWLVVVRLFMHRNREFLLSDHQLGGDLR